MSVDVAWDNEEQSILRYSFAGDWTWNEYRPALQKGREMMQSVSPRKVCIFNDMSQVKRFPPNFISTAHNVIGSRPENMGQAVFYTNHSVFGVLYRILAQLMPDVPTNYLLVSSEQEAYQRLHKWFAEQNTSSKET